MIPIIQNFGLIYKDRFQTLNMTGTDTAIIININSSFGMLMGLVNGALLKKFGYRKISVIGGSLVFAGVFSTSFANNFNSFVVTYGIVTCKFSKYDF